jgi:LPXTG-site transpeptidase (sortase) family protein
VLSALLVLAVGAPLRVLAQSAMDDPQVDVDDDLATSGSNLGRAEWMRIPRIGVDAHISDVTIIDGYYDVPWFDVGHHVDSHDPGDLGNSIFNGHVVTINAGQVFRRLDQLVEGDAVYVYTPAYRLDWVVTDVFSVSAEDSTLLQDTDVPRITLYTCSGQFNPIERSYAERLVVVGELVNVVHRT